MSETFSGQVAIQDGSAQTTIQLDGDTGDISVGGGGQGGVIKLNTAAGAQRLNLNGGLGTIFFLKPAGIPTIALDGDKADISAGGGGEDGDLRLNDGTGDLRVRLDAGGGAQTTERIYLDGAGARIIAGGNVNDGSLVLKSSGGKERLHLSASAAHAQIGGNGAGGHVNLLPKSATDATKANIVLSADDQHIQLREGGKNRITIDGQNGNIWLGGNGADGDLILFPPGATSVVSTKEATILLDGAGSSISVRSGDAKNRILLDGPNANIWMGGNGADGDVLLFREDATSFNTPDAIIHLDPGNSNIIVRSSDRKNRIHLDGGNGNIWLGGNGADGDLVIFPSSATDTGSTTQATIHLDGDAGDIILKNADCAEEFDITPSSALDAGTVMVLDGDGALRESSEAYDKKVAGVLSGAGDYRPGIVLDRQESGANRRPLALVGKVYCKVDADCAPVEVGDLLTTSPTPGHAMKAADPPRAFGAVIGKALRPLKEGRGLIPILVALQ